MQTGLEHGTRGIGIVGAVTRKCLVKTEKTLSGAVVTVIFGVCNSAIVL
jgi:hypothetical protein